MIYDTLSAIETYKGITKNLDTAIDFLVHSSLETLPIGRHEIEKDQVIVLVQTYETKDARSTLYEAHNSYIDIQLTVDGTEHCFCAFREALTESSPFDETKDIGFYEINDSQEIALTLSPGVFCILFPQDAHKPGSTIGEHTSIKKVVVKVRI